MRVTPGSARLTCITQGFVCHFKATVYAEGTSLPSLIHIQQDKHTTAIGYRPTKLSFSTMTHKPVDTHWPGISEIQTAITNQSSLYSRTHNSAVSTQWRTLQSRETKGRNVIYLFSRDVFSLSLEMADEPRVRLCPVLPCCAVRLILH